MDVTFADETQFKLFGYSKKVNPLISKYRAWWKEYGGHGKAWLWRSDVVAMYENFKCWEFCRSRMYNDHIKVA